MVKIAIPRIVGYHNWMAHLAQHKVSEVKQFPPPHQLSALNVSFLVRKVDKSIEDQFRDCFKLMGDVGARQEISRGEGIFTGEARVIKALFPRE